MTTRILSVMVIFIACLFIGFNVTNITEEVQAMPIPTLIEMPKFTPLAYSEKKSATVDINVDLKSREVSVKGTADANVKIVQEDKPVIKYRTKIKRDTTVVSTHPYVKMPVPDPVPLKKALGYE